ncbi:ABC transporter permease [Pseudofulvibacter geojedonensis]|uniref:ABC transporter permease n=1 Tax=Pseudofulvibacter geojedonensis TaxID=1123758 RepID=A0ABW3I0M5_9FLAO
MNFELFIAKGIIAAKQYKSSVSSPIIKIAILAIALGMIMMLIAVAAGIGLQQKIQEKVSAFNGHIIISKYDNNQSDVSAKPISINQGFYPNSSIEGVTHVQAIANKGGVIRTETDFEGVQLKGVGKDYNWSFFKEHLVEGKLPNVLGEKENNELLVSRFLANRLGFELGDKVKTYFPKDDLNKIPSRRFFEVVGIYDSGFQDFDKLIVIADIRHVQRMNKWNKDEEGNYLQVGSFEIFIDDFSNLEQKADELYNQTNSFLNVTPVSQKFDSIFEWIKVFDFNIYLIIGIMIIISVINMSVMLLVLILEKTKLIGILKALGSNNWSVRKVFLYNASYIVLIGLFWGNLIGLSFLHLQDAYGILSFPNPEAYYVKEIPVSINYVYVILLNIVTFTICFLLLLIPSYIITKISPVKAIRFD